MDIDKNGFTHGFQNLRDELAAQRTLLADERTLLAYIRTAVATGAAGGSIIHFKVDGPPMKIFAWFLILISFSLLIYGIYRYHKVVQLIQKID